MTVGRERVQQLQAGIRRAIRARESDGQAGQATMAPAAATGAEAGLRARHLRAQQAATHLLGDLDQVLDLPEKQVAWVEGLDHAPLLRVAPLDVGAELHARLWGREEAPTAVMTSATIPPRLGDRLGLAPGTYDTLDVGSPYAYDEQALLYCPVQLPEPRRPGYEASHARRAGRTYRGGGGKNAGVVHQLAGHDGCCRCHAPAHPVAGADPADLPKPALLAKFSADEHSCLFATMGFWQGVDVRGPTLSLVAIDRLPFPRPGRPLLQARRANLGPNAFSPHRPAAGGHPAGAGTGRLIRSRTDRGVVAVLDSRLGTARYRWELIHALPPMRRTRWRADVEAFLAPLRGSAGRVAVDQ